MKTLFAKLHNGLAIRLEEIPRMNIGPWRERILQSCRDSRARIVALFAHREESAGAGPPVTRLFAVLGLDTTGELRIAAADLFGKNPSYPSLTPDLPEAQAFEREIWEQYGILPEGHPWLKPLRKSENYPFYQVEGEAVHEVAVGPVHAGIIEPGHFRFQCHGEKVFHLEIALGYQYRGVEAMMPKAKASRRALLAESIAGDTAIGHALAYAQALEGLAERPAAQRAESLRAVALELERLANHAGDLGALATDVGFLPANAYFGRLRGEFLNLLMELTGNRYGRSFVRPGGVLFDLNDSMRDDFQKRILKAGSDLKEVAELFFSASTVLARLEQTGVLSREIARSLGLVGPAARASGLARDVRQDYPFGAYRFHYLTPVRLSTGDVYARARIRSLESKRSLEFIRGQMESLVHERPFGETGPLKPSSLVLSLVEGWRGEIAHLLITGELGEILRYKVVDPSFHNWMGLAIALRNGQISDFPLCNKSFNLSYAGHDL